MDIFSLNIGEPFNFARAFAKTAQQAAAPAFELQFFATQNAIQDTMNADIESILSNDLSTSGKTAHLDRKVKALKPQLALVQAYETRTKHNRVTVEYVLVD